MQTLQEMADELRSEFRDWRIEEDCGSGAPVIVEECRDICRVEDAGGDGLELAALLAAAPAMQVAIGRALSKLQEHRPGGFTLAGECGLVDIQNVLLAAFTLSRGLWQGKRVPA